MRAGRYWLINLIEVNEEWEEIFLKVPQKTSKCNRSQFFPILNYEKTVHKIRFSIYFWPPEKINKIMAVFPKKKKKKKKVKISDGLFVH